MATIAEWINAHPKEASAIASMALGLLTAYLMRTK